MGVGSVSCSQCHVGVVLRSIWTSRRTGFGPVNGPVHVMNALEKCDKGRGIFGSHHGKSLKTSSVGVGFSGTVIVNVEWRHYDPFNSEAIFYFVTTWSVYCHFLFF